MRTLEQTGRPGVGSDEDGPCLVVGEVRFEQVVVLYERHDDLQMQGESPVDFAAERLTVVYGRGERRDGLFALPRAMFLTRGATVRVHFGVCP